MWANADERSFSERRNTEWSRYNWRPRSTWLRLERHKGEADARAQLIRDRNHDAIYKEGKEGPGGNRDNEDRRQEQENLEWLDDMSFKNPSEAAVDVTQPLPAPRDY